MLKVECESCRAPYQVDERRVPPTGLKMRCPKCGHTFMVTDPSKAGSAPAVGAPPPMKSKATMVGVGGAGGKLPGLPGSAQKAPPAPAAPPAASFDLPDDDGLDLPAAKPAAPKFAAAKPAPAPTAAVAPLAPLAPAGGGLPGLDDLDLPALAGDVGLPAAAARRPTPRAPAAAPAGPPGFSFEVDLPSPGPAHGFGDLPSRAMGGGGFGDVDLPVARAGVGGGGGFGDLDLPVARAGGAADLPMLQNDLPLVGGNLPAPAGAGLPMHVAGAGLPMHVAGAGLPMHVAGAGLPMHVAGGGLPAVRGGGAFGELDLPMTQNDLPSALGMEAHMPMPVSDDRLMPSPVGGGAFGELDLPLVGGGQQGARDGVSFGEVDLPADPSLAGQSPVGAGGALSFGEVDLGGGETGGQVMGPPPAMSAGSLQYQEAVLPTGGGGHAATGARAPAPGPARPASKAPKIVAAAAALLVVGGAALQFTPVGAFGYIAISDKLHQGDYAKNAASAGDAARNKLAVDTYAAAVSAADELGEQRKRVPRSRPLAAYAAFVEFMNVVRFGPDAGRVARANTFISDVPPEVVAPYLLAAHAAREAANGDWGKARKALDDAASKEPADGIRTDLAVLRGEIDLAEKAYASAVVAFGDAQKAGPSARASYGIARALFADKKLGKAKEAVDATLKLTPTHAGALTLRALLAWELTRDDAVALKDLGTILDEKTRKTLGISELSAALAAKGTILLARDRSSEARVAFDDAVKADSRNVGALIGLGEVLYADGRFTEAMTRFDEATKKDPSSVQAAIGAAKSNIALEHLADAKAMLAAARQRVPKDMGLAMWLAKCEEALGNKPVAEQLYSTAIDLADPANPDAIQAYASFARFLAGQGKVAEAQARLDAAKAKLPDSAALQRAFGEVASTQGQFDEAVAHFESALQKNPGDIGTRFRLGVTYRKMRKLDLATGEFDKVAAGDKDYPGLALERGMLFEESGDVNRALEQFQSAFQKAPKDVDLMLRVGAAYVAIGKVDEALPLLAKVKEQRPNSAEANHYLGRAYLKQGGLDTARAMPLLTRAVELDPNRAEYHLYVAWAANEAAQPQLDLAWAHVDQALKLDKLLADAYWQRGVVERRKSAIEDAVRDLKRALELKPNRIEAHAALAECYEDKNDVAKAMAEWATAIAANEKVPFWRWRYGRLLADKNQWAEAAKHLAYAVSEGKSTQPRPGWLYGAAFESGEAHKKTGQKPAAIEAYQLYMELAPSTEPNRRDAIRALKELGAPFEGR
jgi:predicted Zn finger-like uncharacterized protein